MQNWCHSIGLDSLFQKTPIVTPIIWKKINTPVYLKSKNHRYIFYAEVLNYSILNNDQRFTGSVFKYGSIIVFTSQGSEDSSLLREKKKNITS